MVPWTGRKALEKLDRIVRAIQEGKVPYGVLDLTVYGSAAKGEQRLGDLDLYVELEKDSVPPEDLLAEAAPWMGRGVGRNLRAVLKVYPQEMVQIERGFDPWETRKLDFARLEDVDSRVKDELARLPERREEPKSWKRWRARLERQREKVKSRGYEWPPMGIVVYRRDGKPD